MIPTMVNGTSLTIIVRPSVAGSPEKRRFHSRELMSATGCAPAAEHSSALKTRPAIGFTRSVWK
jgi:hypothetical protein